MVRGGAAVVDADDEVEEDEEEDDDAEAAAALALAAAMNPALLSASLLKSIAMRARLQFLRHSSTPRAARR